MTVDKTKTKTKTKKAQALPPGTMQQIVAIRAMDGVQLPPSTSSFNVYAHRVRRLIETLAGARVRLTDFIWDAEAQHFEVSIERWDAGAAPENLNMSVRGLVHFSPVRYLPAEVDRVALELQTWLATAERMLGAARRAEGAL